MSDLTREEAIKELSVQYLGDSDRMREAKDMAISALSENKWIPCSERLPEKQQRVLASIYGVVSIAYRDRVEWTSLEKYSWHAEDCSYTYLDEEVEAWQPLPEPYKGESEK